MSIQNYFVQVTITRGQIVENDDGTTTKEVTETVKDEVVCFDSEPEAVAKMIVLGNGLEVNQDRLIGEV